MPVRFALAGKDHGEARVKARHDIVDHHTYVNSWVGPLSEWKVIPMKVLLHLAG